MVTTSCHDSFMPNPICLRSIVGSCNGLILISSRINCQWRDLILWNPSTRQVKIIPPPPFAQLERYRKFDDFVHGFGYDDSTDDYMIVCIFFSKPGPYKTQMYSLRTNSWKKIGDFEKGCPATHVNGKLHWLAEEGDGDGNEIIVSLILVDGKYDVVAPPTWFSKYDTKSYILHDLRGYLYLSLVRDDSEFHGEAWVMMKYGEVESWTSIWRVPNFSEPMRPINGVDHLRPIWWTQNGDVVVVDEGSRIVFLNKRSCESRVYAVDVKILHPNIYVESLVSPYQKLGQ